jgi:hypothetical protein
MFFHKKQKFLCCGQRFFKKVKIIIDKSGCLCLNGINILMTLTEILPSLYRAAESRWLVRTGVPMDWQSAS